MPDSLRDQLEAVADQLYGSTWRSNPTVHGILSGFITCAAPAVVAYGDSRAVEARTMFTQAVHTLTADEVTFLDDDSARYMFAAGWNEAVECMRQASAVLAARGSEDGTA